jgi:hypothetical protein
MATYEPLHLDGTCSQTCGCSLTFLEARVLGLSYGLKLLNWFLIHLPIRVSNSNVFKSLSPI